MKKAANLRRITALLLVVVLVLSGMPAEVLAAEQNITIPGASQTTLIAGESQRTQSFNQNWKFYLGASSTAQDQNFDDSNWEDVNLPHDFSIIQSFTTSGEAESGFLPGGTGWYRKHFTMSEADAGKTVLLNFDGVYADAYVYVNGAKVGEHHYGYTAFAIDITDYLIFDGATENVVAVKAVNNTPSSRWYSGSGIYRDVTLLVTAPVHVDRYGTQITTPEIQYGNGAVHVAVDVVNDGAAAAEVTVTNTVVETGDTASTTVTVAAGGTVTAEANPTVDSPSLWSVENPNLYTIRTELSVDGEVVDTYDTTFGFRYFRFDASGFHLNGENVKLNGVCLHHDQGGLGAAAYYDAMYRQLSIMKDMGCNAIRTAHNPADEDFIRICNELGLLVIEEAFDGLVDPKNGNSNDFSKYFESSVDTALYGAVSGMSCAEYAARSMVKRDRNSPAIIAWSFGNEIQEGTYWTNVSRYDEICADFITWIQAEDGTRPATSGDNNRGGSQDLVNVIQTITNAGGIAGFNYANTSTELYNLLQSYGGSNGCIIAAETASHTNSRGQYRNQNNNSNSDGAYHLTSYDTSSVGWGITAHDSIYNTYQYDGVAGEFVWTGFDYIGEPTPWNGTGSGSVSYSGAIPNSSYFGIVETTGFEKDTYYLYRSQWNQAETTLHLVTAWDEDNMMTSGGKTPVWIYSNAPVVKLYRNGVHIGTATRVDHTSAAGHTYYTYTTQSLNSSVCTTSSGSGADGLYCVFNVTYAAGEISAKAFAADGATEIPLTGNSGKASVKTPDAVSRLAVSQNRTEMTADGSSLVYISVDVTDDAGNLDTTATNSISVSLTGAGEIVAVDNGDQATTAKYQQSSVLTSATQAHIKAYAGKALVIVRATKDAGTITVQVSSDGLTGGSATVITTAAAGSQQEGLTSYTMVRDYTVKLGTIPALETTATGTLGDGTAVTGVIVWDALPELSTAGDYTIQGTLTFDGVASIAVTCRLHVVENVIALRNVSTVTTPGTVPALPSTVRGVLADGALYGEYAVTWDGVSADVLTTVGDLVVVQGSAKVFGDQTLPVTVTIRVGEAVNTESSNVAPQYLTLTQDIPQASWSDNLSSIANGTLKPGDNTSERWTNWNYRTTSATATLTFTWATAQMLSSVNLYYYIDNCSNVAESVRFEYSLDGVNFTEIAATGEEVETYSLGAQHTHTFANPINPVALRIILTQQGGTTGAHCVGLTECEIMTFAGRLEKSASADLSGIAVDGAAVEGFAADTLDYTAEGSQVTATTEVNAGVTVLPVLDGVVRILTVSEDGSAEKTYAVTLVDVPACDHGRTELRNQSDATCTEAGYTGDRYCLDCQKVIATGEVVEALGHHHVAGEIVDPTCTTEGYTVYICDRCGDTEHRDVAAALGHITMLCNQKYPTCTEEGYTGDEVCTRCGKTVKYGAALSMKSHNWDAGVVTKEPSETETGIRTYTCQVCGNTRTEEIDKLTTEKKVPQVSVAVARGSDNRLTITAQFEDYENRDDYYEVTEHGVLLILKSRLGTRSLTVNTGGRTRVRFGGYKDDGSFVYHLKPASQNSYYVIRAYLAYTNADGKTVYVYSDHVYGSYNSLK